MRSPQPRLAASLSSLAVHADTLASVRKADLQTGDMVCIKTRNSTYTLRFLGTRNYIVSGGWFNRKGLAPMVTTVAGCTWGGSAIKIDVIAVCGLRIEFGNRLITSPVHKIFVLPRWIQN